MNLSADYQRNHNVHRPQIVPLPVKAGAVIYVAAIVCTDANGLAVRGSDTAGLEPHGVAWEGYDNATGADGTLGTDRQMFGAQRYCRVDQVGEWEFTVQGATPKSGEDALIVDDNTVSADATVNNLKIGRFTRPGNYGGWFVDVERR